MPVYSPQFNIRTPQSFLRELVIPQYQDFVEKNASARHALLTIILVYHMYEWVHGKGNPFSVEHFKSAYPREHDIAEFFELARIITNDTKHFLCKSKTMVQTGFSQAFSDAFARPLNVVFPSGKEEPVDKFLERLVGFWKRQEHLGAFDR